MLQFIKMIILLLVHISIISAQLVNYMYINLAQDPPRH